MSGMQKILLAIGAIIVVILLSVLICVSFNPKQEEGAQPLPDETDQPVSVEVPVEQMYASKIVYTTDMSVDQQALIRDCEQRGGMFDSCGSPCAPDADFCAQVCAYVCTDIPENGN